ncbi:MAG: hypothetical protein Q8M71_03285 [Thermodesulfovibrionales bacterium]|nr:hypothetical protein [Thermodesulfovibrionales bacterium]
MDEIKLKILSILEEKAYHAVELQVFEKAIPNQDLYRHFEYLEQKSLIKLSKIGPFTGTSIPQILSAILTAHGEDVINKAIKEIESTQSISIPKSNGRLKYILESSTYQVVKDIVIPIFQMILSMA